MGDFNGDGKPDLAVTDSENNDVAILLGNGYGTFTLGTNLETTSTFVGGPHSLAVGDFNGDGKEDLAVGIHGGPLSIFLGNGNGTFTAATSPASSGFISSVVTADFNGDGKEDLAVTNFNNTVSILLGNGDGTFVSSTPTFASGNGPLSLVVGDFNGDSKTDLVVGNYFDNTLTVLLGNGDGTFTPSSLTPATGAGPESIAVGDFNGDGRADLAVANAQGNTVTVLLGKGDGTFAEGTSPSTGAEPGSVATGDFNRDGKVDLAVTDSTGVSVLLGNGNGTFMPASAGPPMVGCPLALVAGDFNRDGGADLGAANSCEGTVNVLLIQPTHTKMTAVSNISPLGTGPHQVEASYSGDANYSPSVSGKILLVAAPVVTLSAKSVSFGKQSVGTPSTVNTVTLTNVGKGILDIVSIKLTGTNVSSFLASNNCGASVAVGASCIVSLRFEPKATGAATAALSIVDNASGSPQTISLMGTGIAPAVKLSAISVVFGKQNVGTESVAKTVILSNSGSAALTVTSTKVGGSNASSFTLSNNCGASVLAGTSCAITLYFEPKAVGVATAAIAITDNASGSPQKIVLTGTGTAPVVSLSSTSVTFASQNINTTSVVQSVTLTNSGTGPLSISSMQLTGTNASLFTASNNCGTSVAIGAFCTINLRFNPEAVGVFTAALTFTDGASNSPQTVKLTGTGQSQAVSISLTPAISRLQVFHSQQFSSAVSGSPNKAVTWAVNGIVGGDLTVGQIDSSGFYVAPNTLPSSAGVKITATSQADMTRYASATVTILPDAAAPAIVSVTPTADQTGVALDSTVQIQFSDAVDPSTVNTSTFSISTGGRLLLASVNYDPSSYAVTITPAGIFSAGTQYAVVVSSLVADPAGMTLTGESQWSFTTQSGISTNGNVSTALVANPRTLTVVSYGGAESTPDSQGNFTATVAPLGTALVASMVPGKSFGWLAFAGDLSQGTNSDAVRRVRNMLASQTAASTKRKVFVSNYQITSSLGASGSPSGIVVDSTTTAEALLFMTPYFFNPDPTEAATAQAAIAADPNVPALAQALEGAQNEADPINDATVQADLQQAALSILNTLIRNAGSTTSALRKVPRADVATIARTAVVRRPQPMTSTSPGSLVPLITPNCYIESPGMLNGLQCLDLQYLELSAPISVDAQGNFNVTVNNCWFMQAISPDTGCITSWLVEVAPMTAVPSGGISSIYGVDEEGGQLASPTTDFDPGCTMSTPSQGCSFFWVSGTSAFTDSGYGLSSLIEQALHLSQYAPESGGTAPASFPVPGGTAQNYIVRAYSGGFADLPEYGNILQGYYNSDSGALVVDALAMNALQASVSYAGILFPSDSASAKIALASCVIQDAIHNDDLSKEVTVLSTAVASGQLTKAEMQTLYEDTVNTFVGIDGKYEATCAATLAIDAVKTTYSNLSLEAHLFLNNPKSAVAGLLDSAIQTVVNEIGADEVSGLGEGTQRVVEMIRSATPIETAIVSVAKLNQSPQVTSILPNLLVAAGSLQPITIEGVGFQTGAEIHWRNMATGVITTTIPSSVTPTGMVASMNFTSQAAKWEVQVVDDPANPSTTSSNWLFFPVIASSGSKPDLIPIGVTLSGGSVAAGNAMTVSFTVENQGTGPAAASTTGFRLGSSSSIPPGPSGDIPNSFISTLALTAGQSVQQTQTLTIPSATAAGTYYIWVVVDDVANLTLGQSNTANDYASSPALTVTAGQTPYQQRSLLGRLQIQGPS
jgi:hypothetical protein